MNPLDGLLPELRVLAERHLAACSQRGVTVAITSGWRSPAEQRRLYAKGRTTPGPIVTNATPAKAPHCRGAAYDVVPVIREKPTWDALDLFLIVGLEGEKLGLVWGGRWPKLKDMPHFELPDWRRLPLKESP